MKKSFCIIAAIASLFCGKAMAQTMDFCQAYQTIIQNVPNGFASLKGGSSGTDDQFRYWEAPTLPEGAISCKLSENVDGHYPNYECEFPVKNNNKGHTGFELAKQITACLPVENDEGLDEGDADGSMNILTPKDNSYSYKITIISGWRSTTISISVQSEVQ